MLRPKRLADTGTDLWSTFNVVQENIIKGGIRTAKIGGNGRMRRSTKRAVGNIEKNIKLNKAIFEMATQMQALKES